MSARTLSLVLLLASCGERAAPLVRETHYADGAAWTRDELVANHLHGLSQSWWPDGKPRTSAHYADGQLHGSFESWYANGRPRERASYRAGRLHGERSAWRETGALESQGSFVLGQRSGLWHFLDSDGRPWIEREFGASGRLVRERSHDRIAGELRELEFDPEDGAHAALRVLSDEGAVLREGALRGGSPEGAWREYAPDGTLVLDGVWSDGERHGVWSRWSEDGQLLQTGRLHHGQRAGLWWFADELGALDPARSGVYAGGARVAPPPPDAPNPFDP